MAENNFVNLFNLSYDAINGMKKKDLVDLAFDTVDHSILVQKLELVGLETFQKMVQFLSNKQKIVLIINYYSTSKTIQGLF